MIEQRAATQENYDFVWNLYKATMKVYVEKTWGCWDESWQREHFRTFFRPGELQILVHRGRDIGVLRVEEKSDTVFLASVLILPEEQGRGIGTVVVLQVVSRAAAKALPVSLQVLMVHPSKRLYERLGFSVAGESDTHFRMIRETEESLANGTS